MTKLLMFEVDVKNVMVERNGTEGRMGPARVWGSDCQNGYGVEH